MARIYCPEGKIELPIDMWKCKITDGLCPLQALINTDDWVSFHQRCLAPKDRQQGIRQAISSGKYKGFHHMPGRYLCPMCKPGRRGRWNQAYHYPWELSPLESFVPYDFETLRVELLKRNIPLTAQAGALCRNCLNEALAQLGLPPMDEQLQHQGWGEPMNQDEPLSFYMYRSGRERISGAELIEGECAWCQTRFTWDDKGECVWHVVHTVTSPTGDRPPFFLCGACGERFAALFEIRD